MSNISAVLWITLLLWWCRMSSRHIGGSRWLCPIKTYWTFTKQKPPYCQTSYVLPLKLVLEEQQL